MIGFRLSSMRNSYSNPRLHAEIENWPSGSHRVKAVFNVEATQRGERATRYTEHPSTGVPSAVKKMTYAQKVRIVDGNDGRTYIAELTGFGHISIMKGDCKFQHEVVYENDPGYAELRKLFD